MDTGGKQPQNREGRIELKLFNHVFQCKKCLNWYNVKYEVPFIVSNVSTVQPVGDPRVARPGSTPQQLAPVADGVVFCKKCFDELSCEEHTPQIAVPINGSALKFDPHNK